MKEKSDWKKASLGIDSSIEDAIKILNESALKIVLVVNSKGMLLGAVTDGDVRRALLRGFRLDSSLSNVLNRNPITVMRGLPESEVKKIMLEKRVQSIPIVDDSNFVIGLHGWENIEAQISSNKLMVIMAGGKGTRLLPITEDTPKPMLKLAGKPILEHIINRAKASGISNFAISIYHLGEKIESYFGDGSELNVKIDYLRESEPLGTAGALSLIRGTTEYPVVVTNGDVLTSVNYRDLIDFHTDNEASATMAVQNYSLQVPFGVVETDGIGIRGYKEKPKIETFINAGVYALSSEALSLIPAGVPLSMPDLFLKLMESGYKVITFPIHERWMDLGTHGDFEFAKRELEENHES